MSSLQERVISLVREHREVPVRDLERYLPGIDRGALDCCLSALLRAKKLEQVFGRYILPQPERAKPTADAAPSAAEEAAASLLPEMINCPDCRQDKPRKEFRKLPNGGRNSICNPCHGKRAAKGIALQRELEAAKPAAAPAPETAPERRITIAPQLMDRAMERRAQIARAIAAAEETMAKAQAEAAAGRKELAEFDQMLRLLERFGLAEGGG